MHKDFDRRVSLGFPGPAMTMDAMIPWFEATEGKYEIRRVYSGHAYCNFSALWIDALNAYEAGEARYHAQMHSDVHPPKWWLDIMIPTMIARGVSFISSTVAIKDMRGQVSSGVGDLGESPWCEQPRWRFTMHDVAKMPKVFTAADIGHPDGFLLHNTGLFVCDLADERFRKTDKNGDLICSFNFPKRIFRDPESKEEKPPFVITGESEDFYFSRMMARCGIPSCITQEMTVFHEGRIRWPNCGIWGEEKVDPNFDGSKKKSIEFTGRRQEVTVEA